ncbi:MAG: putative zinc-binding protein [Leptospiraceae bacterium]|nr:putative zinc-binding protein [Leptospiraceae bacterium]
MSDTLPLVYSCSGCSSAAQMANSLALRLDREGLAEMSCIAGVGGGVKPLVKTAKSGRPIIALDGCALACVKHCLARHNLSADRHLILSEFGVAKRKQHLFTEAETGAVYAQVRKHIVRLMPG